MYSTSPATRGLLRVLAVIASIGSSPVASSAADTEITPRFLQAFNNKGPWNEPRAQFNAFLANNSNATGHYDIPGPNISAPAKTAWGDGDTIGGWSWSIFVAADLPLENSSLRHDDSDKDPKYYTGGRILFNAPSSLVGDGGNLTVDDDWELCLYRWELLNESYPEQLRSDNGTCESVLSAECIADMKKAAAPMDDNFCSCPKISDIPSCSSLGDAAKAFETGCYAGYYDASRLRGSEFEEGKLETWGFGDAATHHRGNLTDYDDVGSLAWPVMVSYGYRGNHTASLTCVRAADTVTGSTAPSYEPSSGNSLGASWAGIGAAILVCMLI